MQEKVNKARSLQGASSSDVPSERLKEGTFFFIYLSSVGLAWLGLGGKSQSFGIKMAWFSVGLDFWKGVSSMSIIWSGSMCCDVLLSML